VRKRTGFRLCKTPEEIVRNALAHGLSLEVIQDITGLSQEAIEDLAAK